MLLAIPSTYLVCLIVLQSTVLRVLHNIHLLWSSLCAILHTCSLSLKTCNYKLHKYFTVCCAAIQNSTWNSSRPRKIICYSCVERCSAFRPNDALSVPHLTDYVGSSSLHKYVIRIPQQHNRDCWLVDLKVECLLCVSQILTFSKAAFCAQSSLMCCVRCPNK